MSGTDAPGLATVRNRVGHLTLGDEAGSLATLSLHLAEWERDPKVLAVVLRIAALDDAWPHTGSQAEHAQALALHIGAYAKPVLALLDGTVLAPALCLLSGAALRTVSERTTLRMSHQRESQALQPACDPLLSRMPGALRSYLSLTARSLRPADALYAGLADYCLPSEMIAEFDRCLDGMNWNTHPREALRTLLATLATPRMPGSELKALRLAIDEHFATDSLEAIRASLANESRPAYLDWADETISLLDSHETAATPLQHARVAGGLREAIDRR